MNEPARDPRLRSLADRLGSGPVRRVTILGFDGDDVLVRLVDADTDAAGEVARIPHHETAMRRAGRPTELFVVGQEIDAEEIGRIGPGGQLLLSAKACEVPALRSFLLALDPGQVVEGAVAAVHGFGVFVHVDGEPDGLCTGFVRVPDLATGRRIEHPREVVEAGQRVTAEVIIAEPRSGQVALSLTPMRF